MRCSKLWLYDEMMWQFHIPCETNGSCFFSKIFPTHYFSAHSSSFFFELPFVTSWIISGCWGPKVCWILGDFFARSWKPWEQKQHLTNLTICCRNTWIRSEWYYSIICSDTIKRSRLKSCHLPSLLLSFDRSVVLRNLIWKKICTLLPTNIFYMICKIIIFQFRP